MNIENGFYVPLMPIKDVMKLIDDFRNSINPLCKEILCKLITESAISFYDQYSYDKNSFLIKNDFQTVHEYKKSAFDLAKLTLSSPELISNLDYFKMILNFYPIDDKILGIIICNKKNWISKWMNQFCVHLYDDLNDKQCKKDWEFLGEINHLKGFYANITNPSFEDISINDISENFICDFNKRVKTICEVELINTYTKKYGFNEVEDFKTWQLEKEGKEEIFLLKRNIEMHLKKNLSIKDLNDNLFN